MIRINLLPHREEKRKLRRQQFYFLAGAAAAASLLLAVLVHGVIAGYISAQESKNAFLKKEIAVLDKEIAEIRRLQEQTQALLSRKQIIESLQRDRAETVHLLNDLAQQMPEGVYLKSIKRTALKVQLIGYAQSNALVSALMRNLDASPWLEKPQLVEIKAVEVNKQRLNEFSLNVTISRETEDGKTGSGASAQPAAKGNNT